MVTCWAGGTGLTDGRFGRICWPTAAAPAVVPLSLACCPVLLAQRLPPIASPASHTTPQSLGCPGSWEQQVCWMVMAWLLYAQGPRRVGVRLRTAMISPFEPPTQGGRQPAIAWAANTPCSSLWRCQARVRTSPS
jgi:hypothetical protein